MSTCLLIRMLDLSFWGGRAPPLLGTPFSVWLMTPGAKSKKTSDSSLNAIFVLFCNQCVVLNLCILRNVRHLSRFSYSCNVSIKRIQSPKTAGVDLASKFLVAVFPLKSEAELL